MSIIREWMASGTLYALWAVAFAFTGAPQHAFNLIPPAAGLVAAYVALTAASATVGFPLAFAFLLASVCGLAFALICHGLLVAPLQKFQDPGRAILLSTLGVLGITQAAVAFWRGSELATLRESEIGREIFRNALSEPTIWLVHITLLLGLLALIAAVLYAPRVGLLYRGLCDNRTASAFYRLPVRRLDLFATAAAAFVASIAGILAAGSRAVSPTSGISFAIAGIAGAVLGGSGNLFAAYAGGLTIGLIEVVALWFFPSAVKDGLIGLVLAAVLLWRPTGLFAASPRRV